MANATMRSAAAGMLGGIAGCLAMDCISWAWTVSRRGHTDNNEGSLVQQGGRPEVEKAKQEGHTSGSSESVATSKVAERLAEPFVHRSLSDEERHQGGQLVHYSFGALLGAAYGAAAPHVPGITSAQGIPFGLAVWLGAVEIGLPLAKLTAPPKHYSFGQHCFSALSHVAFGMAAECTRHMISDDLEAQS